MSFQSLSFLAFLALTAIACGLLRPRSALAGQAALGASISAAEAGRLLPCCAPGAS